MANRHTQIATLLMLTLLVALPAGSEQAPQPPAHGTTIRLQIHWNADSPRGHAIRVILDE